MYSFLLYFAFLLAIGIFFKEKQTSSSEFIHGGRQVNYWLTAISAHASDMSVWALMAFPAAFFISGLHNIWIAIGLVVGMYLNWQFVAKKLRVQTESLNCCTLSTFFEARFKDRTHILRLLTALISVVFLTAYISAGLIAMGYLVENIFAINYYTGLLIAIAVVITYVYLGGFMAIARTDLFQGLLLLGAVLVVPLIAYQQLDGWESIHASALSKNISLSLLPDYSLNSLIHILLISSSWGLGYFGQPHIITKFMGIKNPEEIYKSKYIGILWQILVLGAGMCIGLIGIGFFADPLENPEMIFIEMTKKLVFTPLIGLVLCAVIAANMSTIASQILVCASSLSEDMYKYFSKNPNSNLLNVSRYSTVIVTVMAFCIALIKSTTIMIIVEYAWTGLGASFGPLVIMALYFKKANKYGAIAGVLIGAFLAAFWPIINPYVWDAPLPSMIPAFILSLLAIYFISLVTDKFYVIEQTN